MRHRHRNHHARDQPRACRRPATEAHRSHAKISTERFDGAYCLALFNALGEMLVARDPLGIRPLCYAKEGPLFAAASESVALVNLGFAPENIHSLLPGQSDHHRRRPVQHPGGSPSSPPPAHCFFEWVYFANVASTLDGRSGICRARTRRGAGPPRTVPLDEDTIVVPVPDTSKGAADAMAFRLKLPSLEGLIRNRYTGRTFIEGTPRRKRKAQTKYTPLPRCLQASGCSWSKIRSSAPPP